MVKDGRFKPGMKVVDQFRSQGRRQFAAARGIPLTWSIAEEDVAEATRVLFRRNGLAGIKVVHVPPR
jgi:hypothetical protein